MVDETYCATHDCGAHDDEKCGRPGCQHCDAQTVGDRHRLSRQLLALASVIEGGGKPSNSVADDVRRAASALVYTPPPHAMRQVTGRLASLLDADADWLHDEALAGRLPDRCQAVAERIRAALRSEAQGEEYVGEVCHLCGEEFDPRESGTVTGPLGQDDGVPRWYRCPRCARAYDAGYQQGQRDPRGDETADPTALRSETSETPRGEGGGMYADLPPIDRVAHQLANIAFEELAREDYPSVRRELVQRFSAALAALRPEAQVGVLDKLRELICDVAASGVAFEDERLDYLEIQINRQTWDEVCALAAARQGEDEVTYPCRQCGTPRTVAEGGTTFTVCDECWDRQYGRPAAAHLTEAQGEEEVLVQGILAELRRAREKFPGDNVTTLALVEEVGELAKATFEESRDRVREEAIQVAAMAMRVVLDGDQTLDAWREAKGLDPIVVPPAGAKEVGMASEQKAYRVDAYGEAWVYFAETPAKAKYRAYHGARCAGAYPAFADFRVRRAPEYDRLPGVDGKMLWYAEMIRSRTAHPTDRSDDDASM